MQNTAWLVVHALEVHARLWMINLVALLQHASWLTVNSMLGYWRWPKHVFDNHGLIYLFPFQPMYLARDWLPISLLAFILIAWSSHLGRYCSLISLQLPTPCFSSAFMPHINQLRMCKYQAVMKRVQCHDHSVARGWIIHSWQAVQLHTWVFSTHAMHASLNL